MRECIKCSLTKTPNEFKFPQGGAICIECYKQKNKENHKLRASLGREVNDRFKNKYLREEYWHAVIHLSTHDLYTSKCKENDLKQLIDEGYGFIIQPKYL